MVEPIKAPEIKHLVRIADADIKGTKTVLYGLSEIKGVSYMFANAICKLAKLDPHQRIGALQPDAITRVITILEDPTKAGVPSWLLNRRKDRETGIAKHQLSTKLKIAVENDIKELKRIKCYRGVRHIQEAPVRGQRTRSHFRKNKGKVSLGVKVADKTRGRT